MERKKYVYLDPDCMKGLNESQITQVLNNIRGMYEGHMKVVEDIAVMLENKNISADEELDFEDFQNLEGVLYEMNRVFPNKRQDTGDVCEALKSAYDYHEMSVSAMDNIFSICAGTSTDFMEIKISSELALGQVTSALTTLFWDALRYFAFTAMLEVDKEEALTSYPDFAEDIELVVSQTLESWLIKNHIELKSFCKRLEDAMTKYSSVLDISLKYPDEYNAMVEMLEGTNASDIVRVYHAYVLPFDMNCVCTGYVDSEEYAKRLELRGEESSETNRGLIAQVYELCKDEYKWLWDHERYIDVYWCFDVISNKGLNAALKDVLNTRAKESKTSVAETDYF